ncbi:TRAP transporter substrate-binding protein DctP [Pseudonocardia nematodicida]|uniref:TRAP transporter substrate-binding protein DctP n=1 Tax=Pseudonocardia nematodicida TaxID=1206997 RepID=A0ABV1KK04_9PSEU
MRHRTLASVALSAALAITLTACGSGPAGDGTVSMRFGHLYEVDHPFHRCGAEPLAQALADDGIDLQIFPGAQLGGEQELVQSTEFGDLDMSIAGPGAVANWHAPWGVLDAAYAVDDWDHMEQVWAGPVGEELRQGLTEDSGIRAVDLWLYGTRHLTANVEARSPADLAGQKIRAIDTPVSLANARALGSEPVPVAFAELYLALQQGVVDGQENPIPTIQSGRFYEAQSTLNLTGHLVQATVLMVSPDAWESLSPAQQEAFGAELETAGAAVRECVETEEQELLAEWEGSGAFGTIVTADEIDRDAFRAKAEAEVPGQFEAQWGEGLYQRVRETASS